MAATGVITVLENVLQDARDTDPSSDGKTTRPPSPFLPPSSPSVAQPEINGPSAKIRFREFFRNFRNGGVYAYRDELLRRWNRNEYYVEVDLSDLNEYDELLFNMIQTRPGEFMPFIESGAKDALKILLTDPNQQKVDSDKIPDFQVIFKSSQLVQSLRTLTAEHVNKLIKVPGIIISCSKIRAKANSVHLRCTANCPDPYKIISTKNSVGGFAMPPRCMSQQGEGVEKCKGTYVILAHKGDYIDHQSLRLQEAPEEIPSGETPRHISLAVDRYLVDRVAPGTRVSIVGISSLVAGDRGSKGASTRSYYLRVLGIQIDTHSGGRMASLYTPQEEEDMQRLSRDPEIYEKISRSLAPQISGDYTHDIKKALACLLMSGSRKTMPDGTRLRGDINVLLMGDPSTAKSQFLKYIEKVAPIGIYTSGKGSSAAGLTASVIKDSKGEFYLEGGAMVLADGGVICIDEFDKMRETDRVSIHEAMEQQTISIAKAGITTVLNSRVSVLAAANPIFGRYDDLKGVGENIDLMTTILSRFDCIFIVRDLREPERDRSIARHVLGVHINASSIDQFVTNVDIDIGTLKKYVSYCRERCAPRLNDEAAFFLSGQYVHIRNQVRESLRDSEEAQVVPITVRQLEALVRLSESLAKMRLSAEATIADVEEALRLFKVSTLAASQANPALLGVSGGGEDVRRAEEFLRRRVGIKTTANTKKITEEALVQGYTEDSIRKAIHAMVMKSELQELNYRKMLRRLR